MFYGKKPQTARMLTPMKWATQHLSLFYGCSEMGQANLRLNLALYKDLVTVTKKKKKDLV